MDKVLFITPDVPYPPCFGGRIDWYFKILQFREAVRQVCIISPYNHVLDAERFQRHAEKIDIRWFGLQRKTALHQALHPLFPFYAYSNRPSPAQRESLSEFVAAQCADADVVFLEHPYVYEIFRSVLPAFRKKPTIVLRMHNREAQYYQSLAAGMHWGSTRKLFYLWEAARMERYEKMVLGKADLVACISLAEKGQVEKRQNAVWLPAYYGSHQGEPGSTGRGQEGPCGLEDDLKGRKVLLFLSSFVLGHNVGAARWFFKEVFGEIVRLVPEAVLIFGGYHADRLARFTDHPSVYHISNVPSVLPFIERSDLSLVVTFSPSGVKLKLIESLFHQKPVISTNEGVAGSGLEGFVPHTNDPHQFARLCRKALDNGIDYTPSFQAYRNLYDPVENTRRFLRTAEGMREARAGG